MLLRLARFFSSMLSQFLKKLVALQRRLFRYQWDMILRRKPCCTLFRMVRKRLIIFLPRLLNGILYHILYIGQNGIYCSIKCMAQPTVQFFLCFIRQRRFSRKVCQSEPHSLQVTDVEIDLYLFFKTMRHARHMISDTNSRFIIPITIRALAADHPSVPAKAAAVPTLFQ